jgi:dTDP-4-dehydrorhamnose reductase
MILFFGRSGQLAQSFQASQPTSLEGQSLFVSSHEANFEQPRKLAGFLDKYSPEIVVVCSAYTQVDKAEEERELAEKLNVEAPREIARWCGKNDALMIYFSTDYVFSGSGEAPWHEDSETKPLNWYGETKHRGEEAILHSGCRHLIFRTSWIFSEYGRNFVKTMLRAGKEKTKLSVVSDQIGHPTYAPALADSVWKLILRIRAGEKFPSGIYHLAGFGETSWYGFASAIFAEARNLKFPLKVEKVDEVSSESYSSPAQRPLNSRLDLGKFKRIFGFQLPPWQESLNLCLKRIGTSTN